MNVKTEIVALAVRILQDKTNLIDTPDSFTEFFAVLSTGKSYDVRAAESIVELAEKAAKLTKNTNTIRKFKKTIPNHV